MHLVDTHNHLYLEEFNNDREEVIRRALDAGVTSILMPNIDSSSIVPMLALADKYPDLCYPMIGLHPTSVKENFMDEISTVESHLASRKFYGIGETGIDLYWDKSWYKEQLISFRRHLELAEEYKLPVVIHARESIEVIFTELKAFGPGRVNGVFHAFPGGKNEARKAVDLGFMIGVGGVVTFRNSMLGEAVTEAGIDNVVLETDSPYLAPVPYRGKRNESSYLDYIVTRLSEILSIPPSVVAEKTSGNALRLFVSVK